LTYIFWYNPNSDIFLKRNATFKNLSKFSLIIQAILHNLLLFYKQ